VGKAALEGLSGVVKVERGWSGSREINIVYYDPQRITIERMVQALQKAGTYVGRLE